MFNKYGCYILYERTCFFAMSEMIQFELCDQVNRCEFSSFRNRNVFFIKIVELAEVTNKKKKTRYKSNPRKQLNHEN